MKRLVILLSGALLLWQASAFAQSIQGQPVTKEVAEALQLEAQAAALGAQGRAVEAESLYKRSLSIVEQALPNDPVLAGSLNNVGQFYRGQRRFRRSCGSF